MKEPKDEILKSYKFFSSKTLNILTGLVCFSRYYCKEMVDEFIIVLRPSTRGGSVRFEMILLDQVYLRYF